jgi:hypothetical protein
LRIYESKDPELVASVSVPDEWLASDYDKYVAAQWEAQKAGHEAVNVGRLAGVLALALAGRVQLDVPGVVLKDGQAPDVGSITARAMGFIVRAVAIPLESTQLVPFGLRAPSETSTREAAG